MIEIETFYLIDYENVGSDGLAGCKTLKKTDHIIIFFTEHAKKIDMSEIADHGEAELAMIQVPAGKQSADIHIGSYLGYLAGTSKTGSCSVVIISKDSDFDNVLKFWKAKAGIQGSRSRTIKAETTKKKKNAAQPAGQKAGAEEADVSPEARKAINTQVMRQLSKDGYDNDIVGYVASVAVKNYGTKNGKQQTYRSIISKYGQTKGLAIYSLIKKII